MRLSRFATLSLALVCACSHTDAFVYQSSDIGPRSNGADVLLTQNDINYWPTLSEDGSAVLYAYIDESEGTVRPLNQFEQPPLGVFPLHVHRCMGAMRVAGGTRFWEFCDNRTSEIESLNSFPAFAMGADGRLLYIESVGSRKFPFAALGVALWLADSAAPFRRTQLATLPVVVGDSTINWIADIQWTGPATFLALGQKLTLTAHCACSANDSAFAGQQLIRGTISGGVATLAALSGAAGATAYAVVDNGASIVFTRADNANLLKIPVAGGTPAVAASNVAPGGRQVLGLSCRDARCVVATGFVPSGGTSDLRSVSLATGVVATLFSSSQTISVPLLTASGDVIAQVGSGFGRVRTFAATTLRLHLYKGLFPAS